MLSKSKLKTLLRLNDFAPKYGAWRDVMSHGQFVKQGRYYRLRGNEHEFSGGKKRWVVDVSVPCEDFDRWANSQRLHALSLDQFERYCRLVKAIKQGEKA